MEGKYKMFYFKNKVQNICIFFSLGRKKVLCYALTVCTSTYRISTAILKDNYVKTRTQYNYLL